MIVGDIHEEYEEVEPEGYSDFGTRGIYTALQRYYFQIWGRKFHLNIDSVYDTLSGYLIEVLGYIPSEKELPLCTPTAEADYEILKMEDRVIGQRRK